MKIYWAGSFTVVDEFLITNHGNRLVTFAYPNDIKKYISTIIKSKPLIKQNIIIDSGAFSVWNKGDYINLQDYIEFLIQFKKNYSHYFNTMRFVTLDVIPGEKNKVPTNKQKDDAAKKGLDNLYEMLRTFKYNELIHVYHMYENSKYIDKILENIDYIGISPANDASSKTKKNWLTEVFDYLPVVKTHGFAVTALGLIKEFPWYSVDSTSFILSASMGSIMTKWGNFNISIESGKSVLNADPAVQQGIKKYIKEMGMNDNDLYVDYKSRYKFNALYMINLQKQLNESGKGIMQKYTKSQLNLF
jgi:hypothetical protein